MIWHMCVTEAIANYALTWYLFRCGMIPGVELSTAQRTLPDIHNTYVEYSTLFALARQLGSSPMVLVRDLCACATGESWDAASLQLAAGLFKAARLYRIFPCDFTKVKPGDLSLRGTRLQFAQRLLGLYELYIRTVVQSHTDRSQRQDL